jgi:hypothetical protein
MRDGRCEGGGRGRGKGREASVWRFDVWDIAFKLCRTYSLEGTAGISVRETGSTGSLDVGMRRWLVL